MISKLKQVIIIGLFSLLFISYGICKESSKDNTIKLGFSSGLFSGVNLRDAITAIEIYSVKMVEEINRKNKLNFKVSTKIYNNLKEIKLSVQNNECDLLSLTSKDYLEIKDEVNIYPTLMNSNKGADDCFLLLVNKESNIKSLNDLKGKRIVVVSGGKGDFGLIWLGSVLMKNRLNDCPQFFKEIKRAENQSQSILPVFFGQCDACITFTSAYDDICKLNQQISKKMIKLMNSKAVTLGVSCFSTTMNSDLRKRVIDAAKELQNFPIGKQILKLFQLPYVVEYDPQYIKSTEEYLNDYKSYKIKKK